MDEITKEAIIRDLQLYIGNEIRLARLARRMSQRELAQRTGLTSVAICRIENGCSDMKLSTLALIRSALALNVTIKPMGKILSPKEEDEPTDE